MHVTIITMHVTIITMHVTIIEPRCDTTLVAAWSIGHPDATKFNLNSKFGLFHLKFNGF